LKADLIICRECGDQCLYEPCPDCAGENATRSSPEDESSGFSSASSYSASVLEACDRVRRALERIEA
jgi:rRNA maturation protein Nop10